ncbi:MAG: DUF2927 domain-containing protein [Pseudomonadota bacterium]
MAVGLFALAFSLAPAKASFTDAQIANGFYRTVFGLEYEAQGIGARQVKKFTRPVRVYIDHRARIDRRATVRRFVAAVDRHVKGLDIRVVRSPLEANFTVFVVDRAAYAQVIQDDVYNSSRASVRGRCMVRVLTGRRGITQAQAVIVSDEGEFLFHRCMVEEILQGLGPLNDDPTLSQSVFNDASRHTRFMLHDKYILNLLYHPSMQPGMQVRDVRPILGQLISEVRRHVR